MQWSHSNSNASSNETLNNPIHFNTPPPLSQTGSSYPGNNSSTGYQSRLPQNQISLQVVVSHSATRRKVRMGLGVVNIMFSIIVLICSAILGSSTIAGVGSFDNGSNGGYWYAFAIGIGSVLTQGIYIEI